MQFESKNIYVFSGLGADERVFKYLDFGTNTNVTFVKWVKPQQDERIEDYAKRLLSQVEHKSPILVGLSFGGMIAMEIAKMITTEKVILIASAKHKKEIPFYYRLIGLFKLNKLVPVGLLKSSNTFSNYFFGAKNSADKLLLKQILTDTDSAFLTWAINVILNWKNTTTPENIYHIHGNHDLILPHLFVSYDYLVKDGGHLMTLNKFDEINRVLLIQLSSS